MQASHLPKEPQARLQLLQTIETKLQEYTNNTANSEINEHNAQTLKLRIKLIQSCSSEMLSIDRINHLQEIFKHYCTHIFKIGKHMTFQRLQYERVHLTLDRFCILLRDFGLITSTFDLDKEEEIVTDKIHRQKQPKQFDIIQNKEVIRIFKRMSDNCRDLSFEAFITSLEKLAILYYDNKQTYFQKVKRRQEERDNRIKQYQKKMKKKELEAKRNRQRREQQKLPKEKKEEGNVGNQFDNENEQKVDTNKEENDDLIDDMIKNKNIEDPNQQVQNAVNHDQKIVPSQKNQKETQINYEKLLEPQYVLTPEEKIQYYYQMIGVDNVHDFRRRMSELNLPMFNPPKKSASTKLTRNQLTVIVQESEKQENLRLIELRQKLSLKKQKEKSMFTPMSKDQYQERKRKREEKQNEFQKQTVNNSRVQKTNPLKNQRKIDLSDKQISWDFVNKLSYQDLKVKLDIKKLVGADDEDDKIYLEQFGMHLGQKNQKGQKNKKPKRTNSQINNEYADKTVTQITTKHKRNGSQIISDFKKRAKEVEIHEFHREAKLSKFVGNMRKDQRKYGNKTEF